jgi:glycosyltransferase involved in cell wall biosynthesis
MKIVINTSHQRFGGAIQVALSFINECKAFPSHEFYVWVGPGVRKSLKEEEFPDNFHFEHVDFGVVSFSKTFHINKTLRAIENKIQPDVIIATSGPSYFHSSAPQIMGYNLGLYLYTELPFNKEKGWLNKFRFYLKKKMHHYYFKRDASALVVQSDDVNQRVQKVLGIQEVYTATNTASGYYHNWKKYPSKLPNKTEKAFRFITISSYYAHKDLEIIPKVFRELKRRGLNQVEFVLTLKNEDFERHIGTHNGIHNLGPIKPEECPSLYSECQGMFLPTLA